MKQEITTWQERISAFSIHGEAAAACEVERLASELMEARKALSGLIEVEDKFTSDTGMEIDDAITDALVVARKALQ